MAEKPFMVEAEVIARCLQISPSAVYQLAQRNKLPFERHKFGRAVRFKTSDVENYLGMSIDRLLESA